MTDINSHLSLKRETPGRPVLLLRVTMLLDAAVFLIAALLNEGVRVPLGFTELSFPVPIWQAGVGEALIGLALLAATAKKSTKISWVAFWMSVFGILFGLSSPRVQGPAREVHILLVPMAVILFALLLWQRWDNRQVYGEAIVLGPGEAGFLPSRETGPKDNPSQESGPPGWRPVSLAIYGLMLAASAAFAVASVIHFGATISLGPIKVYDPFSGAAIPEAVIAVTLGLGSLAVIFHRPSAWMTALGTTLFALLTTLYGLSVTVRSSRTGDIIFHISILVVLGLITALLLLPAGRRSLPDH